MKINQNLHKVTDQLIRFSPLRSRKRSALRRAHRQFSQRHPEWAASLFDEYFLEHNGKPILEALFDSSGTPSPAMLADAWADQLWLSPASRQQIVAELTSVAADFIRMASSEVRGDRPILNPRVQAA